jgi:hypothetical protein
MFLAVHATVGALAGNLLGSSETAFAMGFVSHFFLDMVPHGDEFMYDGYHSGTARKRAMIYVTADALLTVLLIFAFYCGRDFMHPGRVAAGIAGGLLPDILVGVYEITKPSGRRWFGRQLTKFNRLHFKNHHLIIGRLRNKRDISFQWGVMMQMTTLVALTMIIL